MKREKKKENKKDRKTLLFFYQENSMGSIVFQGERTVYLF